MGLVIKRIGDLVKPVSEKNRTGETFDVLGVAIEKTFIPSVANLIGTDLKKYSVLRKGRFAFNPMHVGRDKRLPVALYRGEGSALISPAYQMFEVVSELILPEFLEIIMKTSRFDHLCWFHTDSSVRGGLSWGDFTDLKIKIPPLEEQESTVAIYQILQNKLNLLFEKKKALHECLIGLYRLLIVNDPTAKKEPLDANISFVNGLAMQKFSASSSEASLPVIKIRELNQGFCDEDSNRCLHTIPQKAVIRSGDLVFSWSATLIADFWGDDTAGLNQHLFKVSSEKYPDWFTFLSIENYISVFQKTADDKGTTFGHIKRSDLTSKLINIPAKFDVLEATFRPLIEGLKNINKELVVLRKLNDLFIERFL